MGHICKCREFVHQGGDFSLVEDGFFLVHVVKQMGGIAAHILFVNKQSGIVVQLIQFGIKGIGVVAEIQIISVGRGVFVPHTGQDKGQGAFRGAANAHSIREIGEAVKLFRIAAVLGDDLFKQDGLIRLPPAPSEPAAEDGDSLRVY